MAALQQQSQKRPFITNWFSSLRRQPKATANKKSSIHHQSVGLFGSNDKRYQRSCIDLRSSTFYIPQSSYIENNCCNNSTDNLLLDRSDQQIPKKICIRCCCAITKQNKSSLAAPTTATSTVSASISETTSETEIPLFNDRNDDYVIESNGISNDYHTIRSSDDSIKDYTSLNSTITSNMSYETEVQRNSHEIYSSSDSESTISCSGPSTPTTPTPITSLAQQHRQQQQSLTSTAYTDATTTNTSIKTDTTSTSIPSSSSSKTAGTATPTATTHIIQKTTEYCRVSTTKTIQTVIVTRPIEILLNEKGEIIAKRRPPQSMAATITTIPKNNFAQNARSNSLDCVLDDTTTIKSTYNPPSVAAPLNILSNDLQYIDDVGTSLTNGDIIQTTITSNITNGHNQLTQNTQDFCTAYKTTTVTTPLPPRSMSISTPGYGNRHNHLNQQQQQQQQQQKHKECSIKADLSHYINKNTNNNSNNNKSNNNNTYSYHNHNYNENNNLIENLCENCRQIIERNLSNRTKQKQLKKKQFKYNAVIYPGNKQIKDELCEVVSEMEALDVPEDCKHSNKDKQMSIGRKKFNMDPKKGIEYLVENRLLRHDPQDVAHFLYKGEGLNKTAIGDYLGENNDFNKDVLKAFVALHDFTNLILVQALRQFLWSFRLPGEAQKIDRMMECFAQRYCQLNPDIFTNTDTCYVLSFAIIMLNTSLHNPSVKDKPTVEQFISMNRGINNGGDLPRTLLESLYESIRTEPFKIPQDDGNDLMHTFFNPDKEGWLWKQGGRYKSWKRRWFILNDNCLYYFEYTTDKEPRGIIPLENISVREIHDRSKPNCFELFATGGADIIKACKTDSEGKVVEGKHTVYRMSAATEEEQQDWIKRLTQSISHNPFYDILVQRKKKAFSKS